MAARTLGERLGARIRARRGALRWSQAQLAEAVGVTPNYVGVLERGEKVPTLETLVVIARQLGVGVADLVGDDAKKDPWVDEVVAVASSVPRGLRQLALAVLRTVATTRGQVPTDAG